MKGGKYADFEHGSIYWHPDTGAVAVPTLVYEVWKRNDWERGLLGFPQRFHVVYKDEVMCRASRAARLPAGMERPATCVMG
ncbi:hypothetical protein GS927_12485 [Rhodococcus hoagii]|nr:hypothetical protein [Prescottella equi]